MQHKGTQTIATQRLLLRPFIPSDAVSAYENWCSDSEVTMFLTWQPHATLDETKSVLATWINNYGDPSFYQWAIVLRDLNQPIGSISVVSKDESVEAVEVGYCIGRPWWHQGIVTEAFTAVIDYFFSTVGALRISAKHDTKNPRSGSVMKACGLLYEGTLRQADRNNLGICDVCVYAILKDEWLAQR